MFLIYDANETHLDTELGLTVDVKGKDFYRNTAGVYQEKVEISGTVDMLIFPVP